MILVIAWAKHVETAEVRPVALFLAALNRPLLPSDYTADQIYVLQLGDSARIILTIGGYAVQMIEIRWQEFLQFAGEGA